MTYGVEKSRGWFRVHTLHKIKDLLIWSLVVERMFALCYEIKGVMSSATHPTPSDVDEEYAFHSTNILDCTSTLPNYFPATSGNISSEFLENSKNDEILPVFSSFYNNLYLKDMQAFYAKESPISPPNPITLPVILTPSSVLPPSPLFDPRYFFVPKELLPPKKQIHPPSSSSTTLSNSSRKQAWS
nr:hypothetical protein [Tanacetum cinerariifolium]